MPRSRAKCLRLMVISDGTGETATNVARAAMRQFQHHDILFTRYKNIRTIEQVDALFKEAVAAHDLILYTVVQREVREHISQISRRQYVRAIDLLGPIPHILFKRISHRTSKPTWHSPGGEQGVF